MHIGFDNSSRFCRNIYYFEYKKIRFKLIQNDYRKSCDVLLTIIDNHNNKKAINDAYSAASEFLSALSWNNNSKIKMRHLGGNSVAENRNLRKARCVCFVPRTPFYYSTGYDICEIPKIETNEQKIALLLFMEALSSNNMYFTYLRLYQIIETGGNPKGWIDNTLSTQRNKVPILDDDIKHLHLRGSSVGEYLKDDCRHAIAHIIRNTGKVEIKLDSIEDYRKVGTALHLMEKLAKFYIKNELKLNKYLYLVRKNGKGFPVFVDAEDMKQYPYKIAYIIKSVKPIRRRKWY
jgi:hypothetical protein